MEYSVSVKKIIEKFDLSVLHMENDGSDILVTDSNTNRPGLQFAGFYEYWDPSRIQVIGRGELAFLFRHTKAEIETICDHFCAQKPILIVLTRNAPVPPPLLASAKKYAIPFLLTEEDTPGFTSALISFLNVELAPRVVQHGVLIEVYGEGVLLLGGSGVGKSETAIELIKRGHRLIADDSVELRRVSRTTIVGSAPNNIRYFMELRGIGIINVMGMFGISAVKLTQQIDLVVQLELWDKNQEYERLGLEEQTYDILGVTKPSVLIPVNPGRNLSVIVEVAAMNNRQRAMGYNSAQELLSNLKKEAAGQLPDMDIYDLGYDKG